MIFATPAKFKAFENKFSKIDLPAVGMIRDDDGEPRYGYMPMVMSEAVCAPSAMKIMLQDFLGSTVVLPIMADSCATYDELKSKILDPISSHFWGVYKDTYGDDFTEKFMTGQLEITDDIHERIQSIIEKTIKEISLRIKPRYNMGGELVASKVVDFSELDGQALIYHSTTLAMLALFMQDGLIVANGNMIFLEAFAFKHERAISFEELAGMADVKGEVDLK